MKNSKNLFLLLTFLSIGLFGCQNDNNTTSTENETTVNSVTIGNQEWQAENLNVERFRNGDLIAHAITEEEWIEAGLRSEPAWCYYDNDSENGKIYGKLYNWYAVNDARGLAPKGWHIPTDEEWTFLTDYLGCEEVAGGKMKTTVTTYWESPNEAATNESGFSALPGGFRNAVGSFDYITYVAHFWSATEDDDYDSLAWSCYLSTNTGNVYRDDEDKYNGQSVRCLRD